MLEPKYYEKIRAAQARIPAGSGGADDFDFSVLKEGGGIGAKLAQSRLLHAVLRSVWPVGRIGRLGWVVRHADVMEVRRRSEDFNVPYGLEMRDLTDGEDFALGMQEGPAYQRQLRFMKAALQRDDTRRLIAPNARRLAEAAVGYSGSEIDAVADLLVRVAVETCADYFGLDVDDPVAFAQWLMSVSTLLFADYLGSDVTRRLALSGSARVRVVIDAAIRKAHEVAAWKKDPPPPGSGLYAAFEAAQRWYDDTLAGRFVAMQLADPADGPRDGEIRAILIGMAVGYVPTGGSAGGNILDVLLRRPHWLSEAQLAARNGDNVRLKKILFEALRFSPPINPGVPRYVARDTELGGARLPKGVMIVSASMAAMFDPRAIEKPGRFDPDRDMSGDLQFGGDAFAHYCIGERITGELLLESFKPLLKQQALRRARGARGRLEKTGPFPEHLCLTFAPGDDCRAQSMVTICVPVTEPVPASEIDRKIEEMGNPAIQAIRSRLDAARRIHFAHVSAIEGERSATGRKISPAYLIVELSADGDADEAIDRFIAGAGEPLLRVFQLGTSVRTPDDLRQILRGGKRRLVSGRLLPAPSTASGLNFPGTPELPVTRIARDAIIAAEARRHLDTHLKNHLMTGSQAAAALEWVRARIREGDFRADLVRPGSVGLAAARRSDRSFPETFASLLADWTFTGKIVAILAAALLFHYALSHGVSTPGGIATFLALSGRVLASLAVGVVVVAAGVAAWRAIRPAASEVRRKTLADIFAENSLGLGIVAFVLTLLHFAVFQNGLGIAGWDEAGWAERTGIMLVTVIDLLNSLAIGALVTMIVLAVLGACLVAILRRSEESAPREDFDPRPDKVKELLRRENADGYAQNHIIAVTPLKTNPRWLRRMTLGLAFWAIEILVRHRFRPGFVLDIGTIHFARWFRLPGTDKLVFLSNYDGSWESYLEDFITKAHLGQTGVWSNGVGFPATKFLILGGAADGAKFKRWVRRQQVPTRFWYSRFPTLTTSQIRNNAMICEGLAKARSDSDCQAWIDLFGSQPRPNSAMEHNEIQSLVFSGMGKLRSAELVPVRFADGDERWRDWLKTLIGVANLPGHHGVTEASGATRRQALLAFGENVPDDFAAVLAFSKDGLERLGLAELPYRLGGNEDGSSLSTFPAGFLDGMMSEERARVLGDVGRNTSHGWSWSAKDGAPHAILLLYAKDAASLGEISADQKKQMQERFGLQVLEGIRMADLPADLENLREPFGFNDGVSQPIVRGTRRFHDGIHPMHAVEPGEFVLGYPDNRGDIPPSPVVDAAFDRGVLPSLTSDLPGRFPGFEPSRGAAPRDLGRNGSYLVVRQLEQDAAGFAAHTEALARQLGNTFAGASVTKEWVAAKMVGRWQDGSSLVRNPFGPGGGPDNEFLFGAEDPQGIKCPYGAHVRRAFPRESLAPDNPEQLSISNRHRLLRRGRAYVSDATETPKGLVFMCLNTDIERQFEFVQQTWITSPDFHGLEGEPDPVVAGARAGGGAQFTMPTASGPMTLKGIQSFVTVRNGGYFFMPGRSAILFLANLQKPAGR